MKSYIQKAGGAVALLAVGSQFSSSDSQQGLLPGANALQIKA
jgi:hypothetical protein